MDAKDGFLQVKLSQQNSCLAFWTNLEAQVAQNSGLTNLTSRRVPSSHTTSTGWTRRDLNCRRRQLIIGRGDTEAEARRDHDKKLDRLLQRAREQNLKLKKAKMRLHMAEINNIGHVLTPEGVKMDPEKIADNKKIPTPTDIERVRRFLRFTHNLTKFMPNLAAVSVPLRRLAQNDFVTTDQRLAYCVST